MPYNILGYIGQFELNPAATCANPCCILTLDCTVQLMGDIEVAGSLSGEPLATLPADCRPGVNTVVPVYITHGDTLELTAFTISTDGSMRTSAEYDAMTVHLSGLNFNVCGVYYNSGIGNNFAQGTAPLTTV